MTVTATVTPTVTATYTEVVTPTVAPTVTATVTVAELRLAENSCSYCHSCNFVVAIVAVTSRLS